MRAQASLFPAGSAGWSSPKCRDSIALAGTPREILGPPGLHDEGVGYALDGTAVYVATEGRPAPLHRLELAPKSLP